MSEFIDTMKKWRRMCDYYVEQYGDNGCYNCPLDEKNCGAIWEMNVDGFDEIEEKVNNWDEPQYPTWVDWLAKMGVISWKDNGDGDGVYIIPTFKMRTQIPADVAEKLGLEPKDDTTGEALPWE